MPKQITEQQLQQVQGTLESLSYVINELTGVQKTANMLQSLPDIEEKGQKK